MPSFQMKINRLVFRDGAAFKENQKHAHRTMSFHGGPGRQGDKPQVPVIQVETYIYGFDKLSRQWGANTKEVTDLSADHLLKR